MGGFTALLPAISAGVSILGGIKTMFSKTPRGPDETAPTVMPTQDSALVMEAKRRALLNAKEKEGRASTILTDEDDSFGGN